MAWGCDRALGIPEELRPPRGWVSLGREFSLVDDAEYPKDPAVTRALKVFWPGLIPMVCRWVFLSPADGGGNRYIKVFKRHAAGEYLENIEPHEIPLEVPPSYEGVIPNRLQWVFEDGPAPGPQELYSAADLPGPYEPWDWLLYWKVRTSFIGGKSVSDLKEMRNKVHERRARENAAARADLDYGMKSFMDWAQRRLSTASDAEIAEMLQRGRMTDVKNRGRLNRIGL